MVKEGTGSTQTRVAALDGLRAVAVLMVICGHLAPTYLPGGGHGVDLFFALSGYLITSILLREFEKSGTISFGHFYLRRIARLMPALVLVLIGACLAVQFAPGNIFGWNEVLYAATYTMNWARAFGYGDSLILGHTWSLGIEEQFYILWPLLLLIVLKWRPSAAPLLSMLLALLSAIVSGLLYWNGASIMRIYNGFDARAVELLVGCALAFLPLQSRFAIFLGRSWFVPALIGIVLSFIPIGFGFYALGGYTLLGLLGAWIIAALQTRSWLARVLEQKFLAYIGRISYGVYLWHYLVQGVAEVNGLHGIPRDLVVVIVTFAAAALSYHFVEAPILRATGNRWSGIPQFSKGG